MKIKMMYLILALILLVLFLAWISFTDQKRLKQHFIYTKGENTEPDSDADMQEQYDYENKKGNNNPQK